MFENKNEKDKNFLSGEVPAVNSELDKQKIITEIGKQPIHTMQKDFFSLGLSEEKPGPALPENDRKKVAVSNAPFAPIKKTERVPMKTFPQLQLDDPAKDKEKGLFSNILIGLISFFIIAILIGGGYYFWVTRLKMAISPDQGIVTPVETAPAFSEKQANYLSVDIQNSDAAALKKTLAQHMEKVSQMNATSPIEFIVTDTLNNPVAFALFAEKFGLRFSPAILTQLNEKFSLYIYVDKAETRLGLSVDSKDQPTLRSALKQEEGILVQNLSPLFPENSNATPATGPFSSSTHKTASIRYANLLTIANISVDYAVLEKQFILGTSKQTIRAILDRLAEEPALITN